MRAFIWSGYVAPCPTGDRWTQRVPNSLACTVLCVVLLALIPTVSIGAQELSAVEERLEKMEEEIRALKEQNQRLEEELSTLREATEVWEEVSPEAEITGAVSASPQFTMGYKNGFRIESSDGQYGFRLNGRVVSRFKAFDSDYPLNDEFSVERARLETEVSLLDYYSLKISTEFAKTIALKDAYMDISYVPWARVRIGQFKVPFAWEFLQSHKYLDFAERSLAIENMRFKGRDMGVMLHGSLFDDLAEYQLAVINGTGENTADDNDGKDLAGRLAFRPFHEMDSELLSKLQLGISGTWGNQNANYSTMAFKTPGGTTFVDFADGTIHKGDRKRLGTELVWLMGPASIKAEWMRMWLDNVQSATAKDDFDFYSWYLSGSYLLTGEKKTLGKIAPIHPFNPAERTWGAWEIAARYGMFHSDADLFDLAMATGTDEAEAVTVGLNWYLNHLVRVTLDYEHTEFDDDISVLGQTVDDEDLIRFQCQLEF